MTLLDRDLLGLTEDDKDAISNRLLDWFGEGLSIEQALVRIYDDPNMAINSRLWAASFYTYIYMQQRSTWSNRWRV